MKKAGATTKVKKVPASVKKTNLMEKVKKGKKCK
jgi:hypothetical protein